MAKLLAGLAGLCSPPAGPEGLRLAVGLCPGASPGCGAVSTGCLGLWAVRASELCTGTLLGTRLALARWLAVARCLAVARWCWLWPDGVGCGPMVLAVAR